MARARTARGQATLETALGLLVFVTILVFGIHFAEVAVLSIKLREAAAGAMWDATAKKMHNLPGEFGPLTGTIGGAGGLATGRYEDFDGRSSRDRGQSITQVFTRGTALTVRCGPNPGISFAPAAVTSGVLRDVYADKGGMSCSARASLFAWRFPENFLDQGGDGFFKASQKTAPLNLCAPGRGGSRCGTVAVLLDDWGLAGPEESRRNPLNDCSGRYCKSVQKVFDANGGVTSAATVALARHTVRAVPPLPICWLSFRGEDEPTAFTEQLTAPPLSLPMDPGPPRERTSWPTTPGAGSPVQQYGDSYGGRTGCFLGGPCS